MVGSNVVRIGHEECRRLLLRDNDPAKPAPDETFADHRTLEIGGERVELAWHGGNHSPDDIYIHFPDHDTLMLVDIVLPGWVPPFYGINLSEDVPGYIAAPATALTYPWKHLIAGHVLGTTENPVESWVVQQARNLLMDLEDTRMSVKFVLHDRDASFTAAFDAVFQAAGATIIRCAVQAPRLTSVMERWICSCRRVRADLTLS